MRNLAEIAKIISRLYDLDFAGRSEGKFNISRSTFREHVAQVALIQDSTLRMIREEIDKDGKALLNIDDVFQVVNIASVRRIRRVPHKVVRELLDQDEGVDPVKILSGLYETPFGVREKGWYRIAPQDLADICGVNRLNPLVLGKTTDELLSKASIWIVEVGHHFLVIRDSTLRRVRKVPDKYVEDHIHDLSSDQIRGVERTRPVVKRVSVKGRSAESHSNKATPKEHDALLGD